MGRTLADDLWSLTGGGRRVRFGSNLSGLGLVSYPEFGSPDVATDDADLPREDGRVFGRDYVAGSSVTLELEARATSTLTAREVVADLRDLWFDRALRQSPGSLWELHSHTGRLVRGRPRQFQPDYSDEQFGVVRVMASFVTNDDCWYAESSQSITVPYRPPLSGGLLFDASAPFYFEGDAEAQSSLLVESELPVWPVITIRGPVVNPVVQVVGEFTLAFDVTVGGGQSLVIDTRPGVRTQKLGSKASNWLLPSGARLSDCRLAAGNYQVVLRGSSASDPASVSVSWRDAFSTF